jgi:hypothetical protein
MTLLSASDCRVASTSSWNTMPNLRRLFPRYRQPVIADTGRVVNGVGHGGAMMLIPASATDLAPKRPGPTLARTSDVVSGTYPLC